MPNPTPIVAPASWHFNDAANWRLRRVELLDSNGEAVFEMDDVEAPPAWSDRAVAICASKYFARGESSIRDMILRVVATLVDWGKEQGYFNTDVLSLPTEGAFRQDLLYILYNQLATFNSPVWFNLGVESRKPQCSACFILAVDDSMESILDWYKNEGLVFKGGSGAGVNISRLREEGAPLATGGTASGPLSFMRGADTVGGIIKSGGTTRRAAKLVCMNVDHPDIMKFIKAKPLEEEKGRTLRAAGYDVSINGKDAESLCYQNANNSIRVTDEFMHAVQTHSEVKLRSRIPGGGYTNIKAEEIFDAIAEAAWQCGDPGLIFADTVQQWNPSSLPIRAANPCSELHYIDNSACNLASVNLAKAHSYIQLMAVARTMFIAQDIMIDKAHYPTENVAVEAHAHRPLGLGFTGLGQALIQRGLGYGTEAGRTKAKEWAACILAAAIETSLDLGEALSPYAAINCAKAATVVQKHIDAILELQRIKPITQSLLERHGTAPDRIHLRNAQFTLVAPGGTTSFMVDAETTGIEPYMAPSYRKKLVGGGEIEVVPQGIKTFRLAHTTVGASLDTEVLRCAYGKNALTAEEHLLMVAAVQPFLSGAASKTVNLSKDATIFDVKRVYARAWELGLKCVAVYRDGCKLDQPIQLEENKVDKSPEPATLSSKGGCVSNAPLPTGRLRLPTTRRAVTHKFEIDGQEGYVTLGLYEDGSVGEMFIRMSKAGSTIAGLLDAVAIAVSMGLQHGVPMATFISKMEFTKFDPRGMTGHTSSSHMELTLASSILDYVFRWIQAYMIDIETCDECGAPLHEWCMGDGGCGEAVVARAAGHQENSLSTVVGEVETTCGICGSMMVRSGTCLTCVSCGATTGCG